MKHISVVFLLQIVFGIASCGNVTFNPWQSESSQEKRNHTEKNLAWLDSQALVFPVTIALVADSQGKPENLRTTIRQLNNQSVNLAILVGDLTDFGLLPEFEWVHDALSEANFPTLTLVGNHDGLAYGRRIYRQMFGPLNYSFSYAGFKFVVWNNNRLEFDDRTLDWHWLETEIQPGRTITLAHVPPISDSHLTKEENQYWMNLQSKNAVSASVHGHIHTHRYWEKGNVQYFVTPALGKGLFYGLMVINEDRSIEFFNCEHSCRKAGQ